MLPLHHRAMTARVLYRTNPVAPRRVGPTLRRMGHSVGDAAERPLSLDLPHGAVKAAGAFGRHRGNRWPESAGQLY